MAMCLSGTRKETVDMTTPRQKTVTQLLIDAADSNSDVANELLPIVYDELRSLASAYFRHERDSHTLQPTALVHEAFLRLVDQPNIKWKSRNQFFALAAKVMRNILVNHAVSKNRLKRGGGRKQVALEAVDIAVGGSDVLDIIALDHALTKLAELDERKAKLVELRFFGGLTSEDAAEVLGISRATAAEDWRLTRAWLSRELRED